MKPTRIIFAGLFALGLIAALLPAGFAQQPVQPPPPGMPGRDPARMIERRITYLNRELKLTADQQKQIRAVLEEDSKNVQKTTGSGAAARRDRLVSGRNAQKRQDEVNAKIKKVLTADQAKKFDTLSSGRGQPGGAMGIDTRLESLGKQLNLTSAQKEKIRPILEKSAENRRSIFANRKEGEDRSALAEVFRKENEKTTKEIEAVLTPEQAKKYRAAQEEQMKRMNRQGENAPR